MVTMVAAAMVTLAAAGIPQQTDVPADARATIAAANAEWLVAMKSGDTSTIAAPYAANGVFVTSSGVVVTGRDAIAKLMQDRFIEMGRATGGTIVQDGVTRQGTLIYEWGHADLEVARASAPATRSSGRYLTVWQKDAATGRWEIIRNLSLPE